MRVSEAYLLASIWSYAPFQGWAPHEDLGAGEVQLPPGDADSGVHEGGGRGFGLLLGAGQREESGDQGGGRGDGDEEGRAPSAEGAVGVSGM